MALPLLILLLLHCCGVARPRHLSQTPAPSNLSYAELRIEGAAALQAIGLDSLTADISVLPAGSINSGPITVQAGKVVVLQGNGGLVEDAGALVPSTFYSNASLAQGGRQAPRVLVQPGGGMHCMHSNLVGPHVSCPNARSVYHRTRTSLPQPQVVCCGFEI